ncbi:MAG TPA: Uma2 family endonuclease [Actinomycetota bacterium]
MAQSELLTFDDLFHFPDDGLRRELIDGELFVSPSPVTRHQEILGRLYLEFGVHVRDVGGGKVFIAPLDILFSDRDVVEPDLIVVADDRLDVIGEKNLRGVPSLLIEVVSDSRYDRVRKRDLYARYGVPLYWIVDPDADRIEVYHHEAGGYAKPEIFEPGDTLTVEFLPGLALDLTTIFAR